MLKKKSKEPTVYSENIYNVYRYWICTMVYETKSGQIKNNMLRCRNTPLSFFDIMRRADNIMKADGMKSVLYFDAKKENVYGLKNAQEEICVQ